MESVLAGAIRWPHRIKTTLDCVRFIDAVGYCLLFPMRTLPLPSLYGAVTRRSSIRWDKSTEKVWHWKDEVGRQRRAFYAKYFKGRGTFISLALLPNFLATDNTAAAPDDHERFYTAGRIGHEASVIWKALEKYGPLATLELRHACKMETATGSLRFKRAMLQLQRLLLIVHFGAEQETAAWASGRFELTSRVFPSQVWSAREISPAVARAAIVAKYLEWHKDASAALLARLFSWSKVDALAAAESANHRAPSSGTPGPPSGPSAAPRPGHR